MRGLDATKAMLLRSMCSSGFGVHYAEGDAVEAAYDAAYARLVARGCTVVTHGPHPDPDSNFEELTKWYITDLGRLDLRVSLPCPPVPT